jgi:uncharacterized membrane protein YjjP (DUF1212 family)
MGPRCRTVLKVIFGLPIALGLLFGSIAGADLAAALADTASAKALAAISVNFAAANPGALPPGGTNQAAATANGTAVVPPGRSIEETKEPTPPATSGSTTEPQPEPTTPPIVTPTGAPEPPSTVPPATTAPEPTPVPETDAPTATAEPIPPSENQPARPASPPAIVDSEVPWSTIAIAAGVILAGVALVVVLSRPSRRKPPAEPDSAELSDFGLDGSEPRHQSGHEAAPTTVVFPTVPLLDRSDRNRAGQYQGTAVDSTMAIDPNLAADPNLAIGPPVVADGRGSSPQQADHLALLVAVGEAMVNSGYPVMSIRRSLEEIAESNGMGHTEVLVFPTAMLVSVGEGSSVMTSAVTAGDSEFKLYQIDALDDVVSATRDRSLSIPRAREAVAAISTAPAPFSPLLRLVAYGLLSVGLAILLGASLLGIGVAAALGVAVGGLLLLGARLPQSYQVLVLMAATFGVSVVVFVLVRNSLDPGVLSSLVAPLVILLPGGLLTTSVIELATGQFMSGAARLAAGGMRLVLLATGIVAAAALVGVPAIRLESSAEPLGQLAPWLAVGLFGVGIAVYQCARPAAIGWIVLVLYVAYGAQVIGAVFFGGVLSAFIGALVMTPVAMLVARHRKGPAMIVSFLPAFWLLVPGALGLVGVTSILDGDSSGLTTLVTTTGTMVAIALGALLALGVTRKL